MHCPCSGTGLVVRHYRPTNSTQCSAMEELEPIDKNLQYDFDFQVCEQHVHVYVQVVV